MLNRVVSEFGAVHDLHDELYREEAIRKLQHL